jgi:prevent-host-death family protein
VSLLLGWRIGNPGSVPLISGRQQPRMVLDRVIDIVKYMTMLIVNIYEAKAKLSEFLDLASKGERVVICKRNQPVAELRAVESVRTEPRPIGLARGQVVVPDSFFQPLPDDILDAFGGVESRAGLLHAADRSASSGCGSIENLPTPATAAAHKASGRPTTRTPRKARRS